MSRPPSPHRPRPTHVPLSIRTTITPTQNSPQQQGQSSSPPHPPYPSYPIPISPEKFPKALKLYTKYCLEEGLAQRIQHPQSATDTTNRLNIPTPTRARSLTSRGSSRAYTPSVSNSAYDGVTDMSSVVSFTGEESPSSATPNGSTELISYTGERVRQRIRRPLSPVTKAKAALIRHLVSCWVCRSRRVPCPFEHHDIASLEKARQAKARTRQRAQSVQQSRSSISNSSQHTSGEISADLSASGGSLGQTNTLLGVGQAEQLLQNPSSDVAPTDSQSPAYAFDADPLAEIPSYRDVPNPANLSLSYANTDPYAGYQDGQMIALGVLRGFYICAHLDGLCQQSFEDAEALQTHFETHFAYNRITPAHRYICFNCQCMNNFPSGPCYSCRNEGTIEIWIYGNFIRGPTYQRYGPDGQDLLRNNSLAPFFQSVYGSGSNMDFQFGGGMNNGNFTTGGMNQGGFYYQNDNSFEDPGSQGDDNGNGYNTPRSGGFPFQGNWAWHRSKESPSTARYWYAKTLQTYRHHKFILLTLVLLVAMTCLYQAHEWLLNKARVFTPLALLSHPNLPVFGFVGVLASFAMCYSYWSVKKLGIQRVRRAQCRPHRCPLHDLPTLSFHYRQTAANTFVRGGVFS